jgi:hypothetical protein
MQKLVRAFYGQASPGRFRLGYLTHLDNGMGQPACGGDARQGRPKGVKSWQLEIGKFPTCKHCQRLQDKGLGGGAA